MRLDNLIEGNAFRDARLDGAARQETEELLQILLEPGRVPCSERVDRIDPHMLAARQPAQQPVRQIYARDHRQHAAQAPLRRHARGVAISDDETTGAERLERAAIIVLADAVE